MQFTPPYSLFSSADYSQKPVSERFKFLEYHKYRLTAEWFAPLGSSKFVLRASAKMGILGYYNDKIGLSPFERFKLGGDGLSGLGGTTFLLGTDIIASRGYDVSDIAANQSAQQGAAAFNKFSMELRYPFTTNPNSTIYALGFVEGSNAWNSVQTYNPLNLYRSAGLGLRVFLPMFGTLGFDYGLGFDKFADPTGKKITDFGKFNIILGFEPE
jgi:outer membrane protein insertion porin family